MLRIQGGIWKKTPVKVPKENVRPTPGRVRETIFNWIKLYKNLEDCIVLDLFSGSGILGLEAVSRGAKKALFIDRNEAAVRNIAALSKKLKPFGRISFRCEDALGWLEREHRNRFDIVFLDPPYQSNALNKCFPLISTILNSGALVYVEKPKSVNLKDLEGFKILNSGKTTTISYQLLRMN
tara:strand:- start:4659 stop:5201 length:543 start_codon:yes stop_codon:yes gene_type:complete